MTTSAPSHSNTAAALDALRQAVRGAVRTDAVTLGAYATDASMYQYLPLAVVEPLDREDAIAAVRVCAAHQLPILPRGAGTSLTGQTTGHSVVIDLSTHCNRLLEINTDQKWARVEPGLVRDELNRQLQPHALHFAPDPATTSRANIGGMIANNSAGMRSIQYGMTIDHVLEVELALSTGEVITLGPATSDDFDPSDTSPAAKIRRTLKDLMNRERSEVINRFPNVSRRSGGYPLDAFTGPLPWNLAKLVAGSEGTLGLILEARIRLEPLPAHAGLCLAHFDTMGACLRAVAPAMVHGPTAVELTDGLILRQAREHPMTRDLCARIIQGDPAGLLLIEARADQPGHVANTLRAIQSMLLRSNDCPHAPIVLDPAEVRSVWNLRESALGLMTTVKGTRKPTPYIEDAAVPLDVLPEYIERVLDICKRHGQPVSLFAHAGAGLIHIRPMHDLHQREDIDQMLAIQDEVFELVQHYGGSWSGEHGDGIIRGAYNRRFFGDRIYQAFREIKHLFDPAGLMNPGKIVETPPRDTHLRFDAYSRPVSINPTLDWSTEGGLLRAAEQCTGIGACRKRNTGVMCPSYMATRDEVHSTRGRANTLRLALTGQLGPDALQSEEVHAVFDLCISCKGCRSECPNKVDVGKMKAEWQHHYYQTHRRPLRDQLFARPVTLARWQIGPIAALTNKVLNTPALRALLDRWIGLDARRPLPAYARHRFSTWFKQHPKPRTGTPVVLYTDVYMEHHEPETGQAAVQLLEAMGYAVTLFAGGDSQRPALSLGMLDRARAQGDNLMQRLAACGHGELPILVLEPSCATALIQDLPELVTDQPGAQQVAQRVRLLETFLMEEIESGRCTPPPLRVPGDESAHVFFHPHCHQRALDGGHATIDLLRKIEGAHVTESGAGCCGMAGAFGYEKEHYDLSVKIAEDRLLPALRAFPDSGILLASGFSCRHQIADLTQRQAQHPVTFLAACASV